MKKELRILGIPVYQMRSDFYPSVGSATNPSEKLIAALGGQATDAGVKIDQDSAITISAVWRAVNILSGTLASLPLKVYQIQKDGTRQSVATHPAQSLMKKPNSLMTDFIFRETMMALLLLWGNAYAVIRRDGDGEILELILVHPDDVIVTKYQNKLYYNVRTDTSQYVTLPQENILHIPGIGFNGLVGKSVITP
jgi:HK97 family phage portal protein